MADGSATRDAVLQLAHDHPDWIPILRAACVVAKNTEPFGGRFAGRWVLQELANQEGVPLVDVWKPGLKRLVAYDLLTKAGESTRGGRRAYYSMPDRAEVERALRDLPGGVGTGTQSSE
jgi:hypothetical protein